MGTVRYRVILSQVEGWGVHLPSPVVELVRIAGRGVKSMAPLACHTPIRAQKKPSDNRYRHFIGSQAGRDRNGQLDMGRAPTEPVPLLETRGSRDPPAPRWMPLSSIKAT